ncbi:HDIG domain-containing protein [bacterium]|nr:HDIG domain-containing protein [candidate division CSSED10-310 bacterium]
MLSWIKKYYLKFNALLRTSLKVRVFAVSCLILAAAYILTPQPTMQIFDLQVGEKAWEDVRSNYEFTVIDEAATNQRRQNAEESILPVYDFDSRLQNKLADKLTEVLNEWRQVLRDRRMQIILSESADASGETADVSTEMPTPTAPAAANTPEGPLSATDTDLQESTDDTEVDYRQFLAGSGLKISKETFRLLKELEFRFNIEESVKSNISYIGSFAIVGNRDLLIESAPNGFIRRDMYSQIERVIHNLDTIMSVEIAYREADDSAARLLPDNQLLQDITAELTRALIRPNLTLNMQETQKRRKAARDSVKPVFFQVSAGEIIISSGERVTPEIKLRLDQLMKLRKTNRLGYVFIGYLLLIILISAIITLEVKRFHKNIGINRQILLVLIIFLYLVLTRAFYSLVTIIPDYMSYSVLDNPYPYRYAIPFAFGCMLIALLLNIRLGILMSFIFGILAFLISENDFLMGIYAVFSGYSAVFAISRYKQRTMILQGGFLVSISNVVFILTLFLLQGKFDFMTFALSALMGLCNGLLVAMVVMVLLPVLEWFFQIPTDLRLLELSNFNQPLLRRLALEAPGTHHHSLMVGDLAEAAAEAIGANSLLAKVGAYYHDIGKVAQPQYFIENVRGKNPHDKLTPNMSAMIIRKHVKQGVELARKAGLGTDIIDIIQQHHGNSLITYFHNKACDSAKSSDSIPVTEEGFRYSGPCPRSKEAAIVLISDSVEAAARSMKSPSPSSLKLMVNKITAAKFQDRQFDDCDLTFRELTIIAETLYDRILRNNHTRIEYPGFNFSTEVGSEEDKNRGNVDA